MVKQFRTEEERQVILSSLESGAVLAATFPNGSIASAAYFDNYDLPCPIRIEVRSKDGETVTVVLRKARHGNVDSEVQVLRALKEFGLPVPEVLCEPFENKLGERVVVYSVLPGENLQKLSILSETGLEQSKQLLVKAVGELTSTTEFMAAHQVAVIIPRITLKDELEFLNRENPWSEEAVFKSAKEKLGAVIVTITTPLVFTNGDYQPGNFLAENNKLTGFLDFELPSFQDPLMGFVKYPIYDLVPLCRTDLIDSFLNENGFSKEDFRLRLALGCLKTLQKEVPVSGGDSETCAYRDRVTDLLEDSIS